jgi:phosphoglycerate dehydrogenase-like enzyme
MKTIYWSRSRNPDTENELGIMFADIEDVFAMSDVVSLHLQLNGETRGIVDRTLLESMKPGAFLVNTARSGLVDGEALLEVLRSGRLGGAGIDVFEQEPLSPHHEFLSMQNVLLSPHVGASTIEAISRARRECLLNVVAYLSGQPRNVVYKG